MVATSTTCLKTTLYTLSVVIFFIAVLIYFSARSQSVESYKPSRYAKGQDSDDTPLPAKGQDSDDTPLPYVAVLEYGDQLGGAMRRFVHLIRLASKWKRRAVDPFILGSGLGIPHRATLRDSIYLSSFYNLSHL